MLTHFFFSFLPCVCLYSDSRPSILSVPRRQLDSDRVVKQEKGEIDIQKRPLGIEQPVSWQPLI